MFSFFDEEQVEDDQVHLPSRTSVDYSGWDRTHHMWGARWVNDAERKAGGGAEYVAVE
jgi:hypothetical protein